MYANTRFKKEINEWGQVTEWINPGDEVSASDLNLSEDSDDWKTLVNTGAVVEEYPEDLDPQTPPAQYYKDNPRESTVDASTPVDEAIGKLDTADERGEKLPGATDAEQAQGDNKEENKPGWMNK